MSEPRKEIGFIERATFGWGGYDDVQFGLSLTFRGGAGSSWGCSTFVGDWGLDRSDYCKWTEEDRIRGLGNAAWKLRNVLRDAHKQHVAELIGTPIEATFESNVLKDWRILTEVIPDRRR